jgi:hypothetical protein
MLTSALAYRQASLLARCVGTNHLNCVENERLCITHVVASELKMMSRGGTKSPLADENKQEETF